MSLVLNVEILGEFKKLTAATQGANKQLKGMGDRSRKISQGIRRAFATIGVGLSFAAITKGFKETTKAAQIDIKGREQLTLAIQNNTEASDEQIKGIHEYIAATEIAAAVSDDELRPALANLVRATKDVVQAQELLEVALDVSAATGKSLEVVTQAMGRALNGSTTALNRLVPSLKNSKNPMEDLAAAFKGANDEAAKQKTWERFEIIIGNLQEMIGELLLPFLEDFADWFTQAYPKIQEFFRKVREALDDPKVKEAFKNLGDSLRRLGESLRKMFGITKTKAADDFIGFFETLAIVITGITDAINTLVNAVKVAMPNLRLFEWISNLPQWLVDTIPRPSTGDVVTPGSQLPNSSARSGGSKTYNINIGGSNVSAQEIVNKIAQLERSQGRQYLYA
jgi:hypothetical protein